MKLALCVLIILAWAKSGYAGQLCLSCSQASNPLSCRQVNICQDDEVCFVNKYETESGVNFYDLGCTYPELCSTVNQMSFLGKRQNNGHHITCQNCCNDTNICNADLQCNLHSAEKSLNESCASHEECMVTLQCINNLCVCPSSDHWSGTHCTPIKRYNEPCVRNGDCVAPLQCHGRRCLCSPYEYWQDNHCKSKVGQSCLACNDIESPAACRHVKTCNKDQVCYLHKFRTESRSELYDLGCSYPEFCVNDYSLSIIGRRTTAGKHLICQKCCNNTNICNVDLNCEHHTIKGINESCMRNEECKISLHCLGNKCSCLQTEYWSGNACYTRKHINTTCGSREECSSNLECINGKCVCRENYYWAEKTCTFCPRECSGVHGNTSGVYKICPQSKIEKIPVYCIISDGEKWTVIQRRFNGSVDFYRSWAEYKQGFGSAYGEYWLGNDNIHSITTNGRHKLSVLLIDFPEAQTYANYTQFSISDEQSKYTLSITGYHGNADDGLSGHNKEPFSTNDSDNQGSGFPKRFHGAWWYFDSGYNSNLNSKYSLTTSNNFDVICWVNCRKVRTQTIMMVKPFI